MTGELEELITKHADFSFLKDEISMSKTTAKSTIRGIEKEAFGRIDDKFDVERFEEKVDEVIEEVL